MLSHRDLIGRRGWFSALGRDGDVVVSSRIRLARNLMDYPFPHMLKAQQEERIQTQIIEAFKGLPQSSKFTILYLKDLSPLERRILLERNLITHDFSLSREKAVIINEDETISLMINEEDHIRIACIREGMSLAAISAELDELDTMLEESLHYAVSMEWGYLNPSLADIGTGMRASLMVHLPALVMTQLIEKALKAVTQVGLAVKGFFGDGMASLGDMYQIANQVSLGLSEEQIVENLNSVAASLVNYERKTRKELLAKRRLEMEDRVFRALGVLTHCRSITSVEAIEQLSCLRLGVSLGLVSSIPLETVNALFFLSQKSHIQKLLESLDESGESRHIDSLRAKLIRESLMDAGGS